MELLILIVHLLAFSYGKSILNTYYNLELHIRRGVNVCLTPILMCNPRFDIWNLGSHIRRGVVHAFTPLLMCIPGFHICNLGLHIRRGVNACPTPLLMCNPRFHISYLGLHIRRGVRKKWQKSLLPFWCEIPGFIYLTWDCTSKGE